MTYETIKPETFQVIHGSLESSLNEGPTPSVDDGLLYGIGFFETINILEGACFLSEHVNRINVSLEAFRIDRRLTEACLRQLIAAHNWHNIVLKIVITKYNTLAIIRMNPYTELHYQDGFSLTQSDVTKSTHSAFIRHKSLNYGENLWALKGAKKAGYNDCLFANEFGNVTESSVANLFIIENNQMITPPLSEGLLPGIIRSKMLQIYSVREEAITPERILKCDGAFLTNSIVGVIKVSAYVGLKLPENPMIDAIRIKMIEEARCSYVV